MRFIEELPSEPRSLLRRIYRGSQHSRVRARAHCILLSAQGYTTTQLMEIFQVTRVTLYNWFNAWESRGVAGLYDRKGKGRKPKVTPKQKEQIKAWAEAFPKNLGTICALSQEDPSVCGPFGRTARSFERRALVELASAKTPNP